MEIWSCTLEQKTSITQLPIDLFSSSLSSYKASIAAAIFLPAYNQKCSSMPSNLEVALIFFANWLSAMMSSLGTSPSFRGVLEIR